MKISETLRKHVTKKTAAILLVAFSINHDFALSGETPAVSAARTPSSVGTPAQGASHRTAENAKGSAGMIIFFDPETGVMAEPPNAAMEALGDRSVEDVEFQSIGVDDLAEVQSTAPGGGYMVHLKGRYMTPLTISRHPDGRLTVQHQSEVFTSDPTTENSEDSGSK